MLDSYLRPLINAPLDRKGRFLAARGVSANAVTLAGFALGLLSFPLLALELYVAAVAMIALNRICDGLDGAVARASKQGGTDFGAFLDIVTDFIFYAGVPFFFALGRPGDALPAAFLIFSFIGTASAFLAYSIIAAKRGIETEERGKKGFYHMGGLTEGTETIIALVLICVFPDYFVWIAYIFGAMCWVTALGRVAEARRSFG